MKKKGSELIFISQIKRDGSGVIVKDDRYNELLKDDIFKLHRLSMSEETYIAFHMNAFVVKLKPEVKHV